MRSHNVLLLHPVLICLRSGAGTLGSLSSLFLSALFLSLAGGEVPQQGTQETPYTLCSLGLPWRDVKVGMCWLQAL